MVWPEQMLLRLPEGAMARIEAVSAEGETRNDFVRQAVEELLQRREEAMARAEGQLP